MTYPQVNLGSVVDLQAGIGFPTRLQGKTSGKFPFAKVGDISRNGRTGKPILSTVDNYIDQTDVESLRAKIIPEGSILFAKIGEAIRQNHRVISHRSLLIDNNAMAAIPSEKIDNLYLYYFLKQVDFYRLAPATTVPALRKSDLEKIKIPLPPLAEQRRIASILDQADDLRQKRQQAIEKLDQLLQATFIDMFGDPVSNPKGWEIGSLNNYGSYKNGLNFGKGESGNQVLYIGVGDFKQLSKIDDVSKLSTIDLDELPSVDYFIKNGDLLFVRSNGNKELVGRCIAVYPNEKLVTYSGFCIRYRIEKSELTSSYLVHLFRSKSFKQTIFDGGQGANIQNINQQLLSRLQIPIPPKDLQEKWSNIVLKIEDQKLKFDQHLKMQNQLFASLQNQAFNGTL
ncbi:restriction endonuclease subunit S [Acinetobacter sp. WU_MDCI_Abxc222]|uniref:restriction endonuclease subunit S n=1 Tax=Acinetobacter sp. WU_MDCI_Abxc222 TaxID=2850076 RepID=UPI0021CD9327|nr:restriction endonuclease subunit S [Acinetobacter sp. WU_MDCI_Abxc222]MCU4563227.1 restriction endonuclease subunit S [Acinetobacter sp. WU_MDCI_Abxc222]